MSVTRDKSTGKWMSQIRVKDWTGKEIHKKKRGFNTKKEAVQWERDFISQADGSLGMKFKDFVALYIKDADPRLRETTLANKRYLSNPLLGFETSIFLYFCLLLLTLCSPFLSQCQTLITSQNQTPFQDKPCDEPSARPRQVLPVPHIPRKPQHSTQGSALASYVMLQEYSCSCTYPHASLPV